MKKKLLFMCVFLLVLTNLRSQDTTDFDALLELSLEELMNMEVKIASKKAEKLYDAPFSVYVITETDIQNSGATSIPEALRLIPGIIVREQTNGIYDVHLMGYEYSVPSSSMAYSSNTTALVMIDNRVVFRDFQGGTYWESLPIAVEDIEKIEVVKGPASALYGPNAVTGVINIVTKRIDKDGIKTNVNAEYGNFNTLISSASLGIKKNKFSAIATGNYQMRNRYQSTYFDIYSDKYVAHPDSIRNIITGGPNGFRMTGEERYPDFENAVDKYGINTFLKYEIDKENFIDISMGTQSSDVQKVYVDVSHTPFTTEKSETKYVNLLSNLKGFNIQASYLDGYQNTLGVLGWEFDFRNFDAQTEYNIKIRDNMRIVPGISYRSVMFDDQVNADNPVGLINGKGELSTMAFSLRNDFTFFDKLRIIAALRFDKYNYPDKVNLSFNFATTYKITESNLLRFTISRANKGANILDTYINYNLLDYIVYSNNKNLKLMTMDLAEIGYRTQISNNLQADFQVNFSKARDYSNVSVIDSIVFNPNATYGLTQYFSSSNISNSPEQIAATISAIYIPSYKVQIKPFITVQKATIVDFDYYSGTNLQDSIYDTENEWTPKLYGGVYLNIIPVKNLNINVNSYFFTGGTFNYLYGHSYTVDNQIIINTKISYKFHRNFTFYVNIRNLNTAQNLTQFAFADKIKPLILGGINIKF